MLQDFRQQNRVIVVFRELHGQEIRAKVAHPGLYLHRLLQQVARGIADCLRVDVDPGHFRAAAPQQQRTGSLGTTDIQDAAALRLSANPIDPYLLAIHEIIAQQAFIGLGDAVVILVFIFRIRPIIRLRGCLYL